jgi:hypothetical protein
MIATHQIPSSAWLKLPNKSNDIKIQNITDYTLSDGEGKSRAQPEEVINYPNGE